ncbi:zinc-ribbon domain-containing protein [Eubacteriaceae bacterium ES3]|nr:zinc-ribbon domain-containing protein [Eubacteriaceae bacterium ES3]
MYCKNCGKEIPDNSVFCTNCGAKQTSSSGSVQPSQPVIQNSSAQQERKEYRQSSTQQNGEVDVLSMGQYLIMFLLTAVPIVGIVMLFVWGFGSQSGPNKKNFARAYLIMMLIGIVLSILLSGVIGAIMASMMSSMYYY